MVLRKYILKSCIKYGQANAGHLYSYNAAEMTQSSFNENISIVIIDENKFSISEYVTVKCVFVVKTGFK